MPLATRLLRFFLAALALVLVGFSATLYGLADVHLYRQAEDRLNAMMNVLRAATDVDTDGVEFDLHERAVNLTSDGPSVLWRVTDERGQRIDGSRDSDGDSIFDFPNSRLPIHHWANWLVSKEIVDAPTTLRQLGPKKHYFVIIDV